MRQDKRYWLDDSRNVDKVFYALCGLCAVVQLLDLAYHKHVHFSFESWFGFHGWYGFVGCVFLVLVGKGMRRILGRREDYYD